MKTIITLLGILFFTATFSQQNASKNDIIMTTDGQLLQVKVVKVTENAVSFNYPGESVVNEIRPAKIDKIVFASGRTQNFSADDTTSSGSATNSANKRTSASEDFLPVEEALPETPSYQEGLLTVVPIDFRRNDKYEKNLASTATKYVIGLISNEASSHGIEVQPMSTTIEKLIDSGFSYDKLRKSSPEELRSALGAEYLMFVAIEENEKGLEPENNLLTESSEKGTQVVRTVNIRIFGVEDKEEFFETHFTENIFIKNPTDDANILASGKWKSSLRYLTEQLYASGTFMK